MSFDIREAFIKQFTVEILLKLNNESPRIQIVTCQKKDCGNTKAKHIYQILFKKLIKRIL